ncbi:hypothetical protein C2G38_2304621 [Gigaspora rosea]|uniref:Uncharacterized protein n=1 Tax=Gigaspora rosea TaxID=44941 RepID=A0A397VEI7_9GLOM|nr:hypothetical protein C2G38_2304621 [Gigaspora rosea]
MKILPKSARETKQDWFGKNGWTLHSVLVYTKHNSSKLKVQAFDHWSADMRQDSWFTASSLHAVMELLKNTIKSVIIMSNNGSHYHNADLMIIMGYWPKWYGIQVEKWVFLEAGEAKTTIDSHHAQISHAINRYVRLGFDISEGQDIENAIQNIRGTSVANLKPNRDRGSGKNSLPGNSNWFEWQWPTTEKLAGSILARAIPNIGNWKVFSPADLEKLCKKDICKPNPEISIHTTPCSDWEISIPNATRKFLFIENLNPTRLNKKNLIKELNLRGIETNEKENRRTLISNLEIQLETDIKNAKLCRDINPDVLVEKINMSNDRLNTVNFPLPSGWALKEMQKYGKKGAGKRIAKKVRKILEGYFLAGNADKIDRYTVQDMYQALQQRVLEGDI